MVASPEAFVDGAVNTAAVKVREFFDYRGMWRKATRALGDRPVPAAAIASFRVRLRYMGSGPTGDGGAYPFPHRLPIIIDRMGLQPYNCPRYMSHVDLNTSRAERCGMYTSDGSRSGVGS